MTFCTTHISGYLPEAIIRAAAKLSKRHVAAGVLTLAIVMQFVDMGIDMTTVFQTGHAETADLVGMSDFLFGCVAALLFKR